MPADASLPEEPGWPLQPGPYLFALEVSGPYEQRLLEGWIARHQPPHLGPGVVQVARLPTTRRRHRRIRRDPALEAFLLADEDALVVPLRVAWLPRVRDGRRRVGLRDLLSFGDPRDPDPVRQYVIGSLSPDRVRVLRGEPARTSDLRRAWATPGRPSEGRSFVDEVAHRAWLVLERAERELRGARYKVPKFPRETLVRRRAFRTGVARLARETGIPYARMAARTRRYVREIAATHSPYVIDLVTGGFRWLIGKAYVSIDYDPGRLSSIYQRSHRHPLVFLPTHKSHFDHQSLQYALYENGLPPNHTAGGINMNFFPVGPLIRRSGVFFIRREFKHNAAYKFVLRQYLDYLLERRFPLEWYLEGARSRTGKLLPPRYGLLAYVVESFLRGSADDVVFVPVCIAYDQIQDVGSYAAEQAGGEKRPESFGWFLETVRSLRWRYGSIYLRFAEPVSLAWFLEELGERPEDADDLKSPAIPKLAFEIAHRINEVTPITPTALVALVAMASERRRVSVEQAVEAAEPYLALIERRRLPVTQRIAAGDPGPVQAALEDLVLHGVVAKRGEGAGRVYSVEPDRHLTAAYYRNTIAHHFVNGAIAELALREAQDRSHDLAEAVVEEAVEIRDLLKFEFFFSPRRRFVTEIEGELDDHDPEWRARLAAGDPGAVLDRLVPLRLGATLAPFLTSYRVVADVLAAEEGAVDKERVVKEAVALGRRRLADGSITTAESVSTVVFGSALRLAENLGLLDPEAADQRKALAARLAELEDRARA